MARFQLVIDVDVDNPALVDTRINELLDGWQSVPAPEGVRWDDSVWWEVTE
jgi:hypothetical protein